MTARREITEVGQATPMGRPGAAPPSGSATSTTAVSEAELDALDDAIFGPADGAPAVRSRVAEAPAAPPATGSVVSEADLDDLDDAVFGAVKEG